ncbi:MAG: hypothetical protein HY318_13620, partial [Armatimonadetes bacterium]|nr:hypothetical protein [Armatimonadota bacterium]
MSMIHGMVVRISLLWLVLCIEGSLVVGEEPRNEVSVNDSGSQYSQATSQKHSGHKWERRTMALENSLARYSFLYSACVDPSHPNDRAFDEGYFGMPGPSSCNWYHGGFLSLNLNGRDIGTVPLADMRVIETGTRGSFQ